MLPERRPHGQIEDRGIPRARQGSQPAACPSASRQTGALPSSAASTSERTPSRVRQALCTTKNSARAASVVMSPIPRPKLPNTLSPGATDAAVETTTQTAQATRDQTERPSQAIGDGGPERATVPRPGDPDDERRRDEDGQRPRLRIVVRARGAAEHRDRDGQHHRREPDADRDRAHERGTIGATGTGAAGAARTAARPFPLGTAVPLAAGRGRPALCAASRAQSAPSPQMTTGIVRSKMRKSRPSDHRST